MYYHGNQTKKHHEYFTIFLFYLRVYIKTCKRLQGRFLSDERFWCGRFSNNLLVLQGIQSQSDTEQPIVSMMGAPWSLGPDGLETWYNANIQKGTHDFDKDCRAAVDRVVQTVHNLFDVDRVVKGGSLGKGTMVQGLSDVDLIAFVNPPHLQPIVKLGPKEYKRKLATVIEDLKKALGAVVGFAKINFSNAFMINLSMTVGSTALTVDLLPTSDNCLGHGHDHAGMFRAMLHLHSDDDRQFYSASLAEHQLSFVRGKPGSVKELIRLVKHWSSVYLPGSLQKSYRLELITIHRWKAAGEPLRFSKAQGLKDVMQTLTRLRALRVYDWDYIYKKPLAEEAIRQLDMINPIVLDPANPTNNVCQLYQEGNNMAIITEAASNTLGEPLLLKTVMLPNWKG